MNFSTIRTWAIAGCCFLGVASVAIADDPHLRPYVLGKAVPGTLEEVVTSVKTALKSQGFEEAGDYSPYAGAHVIVVTNPELKQAATRAKYSGFGTGQRVAVTDVNGRIQVSYANPAYVSAAYGLGSLDITVAKLKAALGAEQDFGSAAGLTADQLAPGTYHYMVGMPFFNQVDELGRFANYQAAVAAIEKNLAAGKGGTRKVYRIDVPGKEITVFGVAIVTGDGIAAGAKDTDKEIMDIIDWQPLRSTAYLPYEILVQGNDAVAMRARYRVAVYFPDTLMAGAHGFTKIMSAPGGIKSALLAVTGGGTVR